MKRILALLLTALLLTVPASAEDAETLVYVLEGNEGEYGYPEIAEDLAWAFEWYGIGAEAASEDDDLLESVTSFSSGTGFFVSPDTIVTNAHVVEDAPDDIVIDSDGEEIPCELVYLDPEEDLAILKTERRSAPYFNVLRKGEYKPAEPILVLGYPLSDLLGGEIRITNGIINALSGISGDRDYIQISAPIQPGNSGGPVVNSRFEVAGIASETLDGSAMDGLPQNLNFALKADVIRDRAGKWLPKGRGNYVSTVDEAIAATVEIHAGSSGAGGAVPYAVVYAWDETEDEGGSYISAYLTAVDISGEDMETAGVVGFEGFTTASYENTLLYLVSELMDRMIEYEEAL